MTVNYSETLQLYVQAAEKLQEDPHVTASNCCWKELQSLLLQADKWEYWTAFIWCIHDIWALSALAMHQSGLPLEDNEHNTNQQ